MNARHWLALAALSLTLAGCSSGPTIPVISTPLSLLTLTPDSTTLYVGGKTTFTVTALDTNGAIVARPVVEFSSGDKTVFTVTTSAGTATVLGVAEGSAGLTASSGGLTASAQVQVLPTTTGWFLQTSNTSAELNDVAFRADGNTGWAVGDAGTIQFTTTSGRSWARQVSSTGFPLYGVWFTGPAEGWAVGGAGTVLHTTNSGTMWTRVNVSTSFTLYDVAFTDTDHGAIVGSNGLILSTDDGGATWQRRFPTFHSLRSVAFNGLGDGWAVGDAGIIVGTHDGGGSWFVLQPALTGLDLRAVRWRDAAFANAVGIQGVTPRTVSTPDSVAWELRNTGASYRLEGLCFTSPSSGYAVGYNGSGTILTTTNAGQTWTTQPSNTQFSLRAVTFIDGLRGWAVGGNGTVLHTVTGGTP